MEMEVLILGSFGTYPELADALRHLAEILSKKESDNSPTEIILNKASELYMKAAPAGCDRHDLLIDLEKMHKILHRAPGS